MKNIQIITDSSADLSKELVEKYGIDVVPFYVSFSEETYLKEGEEISQKDFYDQLVSSEANPKTACPSIDDYYTRFEKAVKENAAVSFRWRDDRIRDPRERKIRRTSA